MGDCVLQCSDVYDERRFYTETIAHLRAFLASNAMVDTEISILYDVQPDGTYIAFYRYIKVECNGEIVITDYTLNPDVNGNPVPYTPTGTVVAVSPPIAVNAVAHNLSITGDYTIPSGFIHGSLAVVSGEADFDGVTYPQSSSLCLPPMSFNGIDRLYPAFPITNVTGEVLINYYTRT